MAVSTALLLWEGRHQTFFNDEWDLILHRRGHGVDTLLQAEHGHLVLVPVLVYKLLLQAFGTGSYWPYRLTAIALGLLCAGLLYVLCRRRVGPILALAPAVLMLFLGAAWEQLLWPLGITVSCGLIGGLGMLVALDRDDRRADLAACGLLGLALASFSIGLAFAVAAIVEVLFTPRARRWRRLWIAAIPLVFYGLWTIAYGQSQAMASNVASMPVFVTESAAGVASSLTGLFRVPGTAPGEVVAFPPFSIEWGRPIAVLAAVAVIARLARPERVPARLWALVGLLLAFWVSAALVEGPGRSAGASRYQYPGALFALLLVAEMVRGVRLRLAGGLLLAGGIAFALIANLANLRDGARFLTGHAEVNRAELAALELAKGRAAEGFSPEGIGTYGPAAAHYLHFVDAASYFSLTEKFGSPADSLPELARSSQTARQAADVVLVRALGLTLQPVTQARTSGAAPQGKAGASGGSLVSKGACLEFRPASNMATLTVDVPTNGLVVRSHAGPLVGVKLRRFGDGFVAVLGVLPGGSAARIRLPPDRARQPWRAQIITTGAQPVSVCSERGR